MKKIGKWKSIYFPNLFVFGGPCKHWGGCFRYLLSTKDTFLPSNASRPPPFIRFSTHNMHGKNNIAIENTL